MEVGIGDMSVEVAVIDSGIASEWLKKPISCNMEITEGGICVDFLYDREEPFFFHGTDCALIIEKYYPGAELIGVRILDQDGRGILDRLEPALEWCAQKGVVLINLSLGTTDFRDKSSIRRVINYYVNRGMILVAASANNNYKTYPASLSNVIGVASGENFGIDMDLQRQKGIDFIAPSNHDIEIEGETVPLGKSNSYAAPYVTAMIGNLLEKESCNNVCRIRRELLPETTEKRFSLYPDWIETAWVSERCEFSRAAYYFKEIKGKLESCISKIDTIVVRDREEFVKYNHKGKHIVYLGSEPVEYSVADRHFWSREQRVAQIVGSRKRASDIEIPVIICKLPKEQDAILVLSEWRACFWKDGYNVYAISNKAECVLYDLEFLPEELCNESSVNQVHNFLYWQTYYCQSDAILLGVNTDSIACFNMWDAVADMVIEIEDTDRAVKVRVYCDGRLEGEERFACLDRRVIGICYQRILKLFTEDADE